MIFDDATIKDLRRGGLKVVDPSTGTPPRPLPKEPEKPDPMAQLIEKLDALLSRPQQVPPAPSIVVQPPEVKVVQQATPPPSAPEPIRGWEFTLTKNSQGHTTKIVAKAIT